VARLGSWELDLETRVMWGSDEAFRIYGLELTEDRSLPYDVVKEIPLPEERPALDRALADLIEHGIPYEIRFRIRRLNDGVIRHIHSFAEAIRDPGGRRFLITGTIQDVTAYEEANRTLQEALRANEERASLILEQAADAIFIASPEHGYSQVNEQACQLTGFSRDELLGHDLRLLFDPEELAREPPRDELLERGQTVVRERLLTRRDGVRIPVEMRSKKLSDGSYQSIVRDISERKRLEEQLFLRDRMDSLGTLASGIAHDFNNSLAAIVGYADALQISGGLVEVEQRRRVVGILQACRRAADLVRGLQMLTRPTPFESECFDLATVAAEVFRVLSETTNRLIAKEMLIPLGRFPIRGDASAVYHALMNLGINAVQAIEEKGPSGNDFIRIEARDHEERDFDPLPLERGRYVHVTMCDSGVGMSTEVRRRAFDLLYSTKRKGERKGQGLGLPVVYNVVVRQHHGMIDIDTDAGKGTTFHLFLPRGAEVEHAETPVAPVVRGGDETILVVEDETEIGALTCQVLEQLGYTTLSAIDGQEGLELFADRAGAIDLVILDRTLPRLSGEELLQRMRSQVPDIKVIISSGDSSTDLESIPGASAILHKPYRLAQLFDAIRDTLDGSAASPAD